jgi:hypothetical protein
MHAASSASLPSILRSNMQSCSCSTLGLAMHPFAHQKQHNASAAKIGNPLWNLLAWLHDD